MRKQKIAISHFTAQSGAYIHGLESQSPTLFISLWIILSQHEQIKCANGMTLLRRIFNMFFIFVYKVKDGREGKK